MKKQIIKFQYLALCTILVLNLFSCSTNNTHPENIKKIEVTGSSEAEYTPDEIFFTFTLTEYKNIDKKKMNLDNIKSEFITLCKNAGIADSNITVSNSSGNEQYDYSNYRKRKTEPEFLRTISYTVKVNKLAQIDPIVNNLNEKSVENYYISKTSYSKIEELRKTVKSKALIACKTKAEYLAKSVDEEIGETLHIQEIEGVSVGGFYMEDRAISNSAYNENVSTSESISLKKEILRYEMKAEFKLK